MSLSVAGLSVVPCLALLVLGCWAWSRACRPAGRSIARRRARPFGPAQGLGRAVRDRLGRPPDQDRDRIVGRLLLAGGLALITEPATVAVVAGLALIAPAWASRRAVRRRDQAVRSELPAVVDLTAVALRSGYGVVGALELVAGRLGRRPRRSTGLVATAVEAAAERHRIGMALAEALEGLTEELGPIARPFVDALGAQDRIGASVALTLGDVAEDIRAEHRLVAETAARRLPVQMLFPLIVCILPAFVLLTVAPVVADAVGSFSL